MSLFDLLPAALLHYIFNELSDSATCLSFGTASRATWLMIRNADVNSAPRSFTHPILSRLATIGCHKKVDMLHVSLSALYHARKLWFANVSQKFVWTTLVNNPNDKVQLRDRMMPIRYAWFVTSSDILFSFEFSGQMKTLLYYFSSRNAKHMIQNVLQINPLKLLQMWLTRRLLQPFPHPWIVINDTCRVLDMKTTESDFWVWIEQTFSSENYIDCYAPNATKWYLNHNQYCGEYYVRNQTKYNESKRTRIPFLLALVKLTPEEH